MGIASWRLYVIDSFSNVLFSGVGTSDRTRDTEESEQKTFYQAPSYAHKHVLSILFWFLKFVLGDDNCIFWKNYSLDNDYKYIFTNNRVLLYQMG